MVRRLIISLLAVLACSSIHANNDWSTYDGYNMYPVDKSDCCFPFTYNNKTYTDCTVDGDNGNMPWCSLTPVYQGVATYCYDFRHPKVKCLDWYPVNGKNFSGCQILTKSSPYKQCKPNITDTSLDISLMNCPDAMNTPRKQYQKCSYRNCDAAYKSISADHTMCFAPSDFAIRVPISESEKQDLLDMHNGYRSAVPAKHMYPLHWDNELAKLAQARADLCFFDHDLAANRLSLVYGWKNGQNMVMSDEIRSSLASLIDMMLGSEQPNFVYGVGCQPEGTCLHYTQAMISELTRVGCAHTHCVYPDRIERFLVCNYIQSQYASTYTRPYENTTDDQAGSDCPTKNVNGLCECGPKICKYDQGEKIHPDSCTCRQPTAKRSLNKRAATEGLVAVPHGPPMDATKRRKRDFNIVSGRGPSSKPKFNVHGHVSDE